MLIVISFGPWGNQVHIPLGNVHENDIALACVVHVPLGTSQSQTMMQHQGAHSFLGTLIMLFSDHVEHRSTNDNDKGSAKIAQRQCSDVWGHSRKHGDSQ